MSRGLHLLRRLLRGGESVRARNWQARSAAEARAQERFDAVRFREAMGREPGPSRVTLGRARDVDGNWFWCGQSLEEFLRRHSWITGATGSGKSYFTLACLLQVFGRPIPSRRRGPQERNSPISCSTSSCRSLSHLRSGEALLRNLRIIRPFGRDLPDVASHRARGRRAAADSSLQSCLGARRCALRRSGLADGACVPAARQFGDRTRLSTDRDPALARISGSVRCGRAAIERIRSCANMRVRGSHGRAGRRSMHFSRDSTPSCSSMK